MRISDWSSDVCSSDLLGLSRVRSLEELIVTADLFERIGAIHGSGVAFVAMSGGMREIITDQADVERIALPALTADTHAAMSAVLPPLATPNTPPDGTGPGMNEPELTAPPTNKRKRD